MIRPVYLNAQSIAQQMEPRIQIGDIVYFLSADGQKIMCLEDPTDFGLYPDQDFNEMKFTAKLLDNQSIQNLPNRCFFKVCTSKAEIGSHVRYGDMVCFKLDSSSSYITQLTEPEPDMAHYKISFTKFEEDPNEVPYPKEFCWKFRPKYKHRQDGSYVFENDKVSIETFLDQEGFLTPMAHGKIAGGLNEYEWKIKTFSDVGDVSLLKVAEEEVPVRAQEPVTFFSFESGKYLGVEAGAEEKSLVQYIEKNLKNSSHMLTLIDNQVQENRNYFKTTGFYQNKIFREKQQEENQQPFNGLYRIELEDPLSNETLKTGSKVRINHMQYGGYLTLVKREDLERIKKAEEQESQENQQIPEEMNELLDYDEEAEFFKEEAKKEHDTHLRGESDEEEEEEEEQKAQQKQAQLARSQTVDQRSMMEKMKAKKEELQKTMAQKKQQIESKIAQVKQGFQQATQPSQELKQKIPEGRASIIQQSTKEVKECQDQKKVPD